MATAPTARSASSDSLAEPPLPADDPTLFDLDLRGLRERWAPTAARSPMTAEAMVGADRRAQALGVAGGRVVGAGGGGAGPSRPARRRPRRPGRSRSTPNAGATARS